MTIQECYKKMGADYQEVLGRLYNEAMICKFVRMFLQDDSFQILEEALRRGDVKEAFRGAHTLKGVCQNLGFSNLYAPTYTLTETLRAGQLSGCPTLFFYGMRLKAQNHPLVPPHSLRYDREKEGRSPIMSKHILVCLPISAEQKTRIEAVQGFAYRFTTPDTATVEDALWADAVLGNLPVPLIRQNDHLEWFQSNAAGPNNYLEPGVLPEECIVTNATGAYGLAISECMLAMWLSLLKELPTYRDNQREHRWAPTGHSVGSIAGSRVLCVGMGDIGSNFARRAYALGAEVVGVRRTVHPDTPCPDYCTRVVAQSELDAELPQADLVALSLPGTPETLHLFGAERLALCKPGAILLNVGRGTAVDGEALAAAVHSGRLSGAGLDVTDPEPLPPEHPLWAEPNVIITPHVTGGFSLPKTLDNIVDIFAHNLKRYAAGQPLDNQMDRRTQYASGARLQSTL